MVSSAADSSTLRRIRVSLVVARADNGVIGKDGKLPWHIPTDLQYFKRVTLGKPVIMGRKTFDSIGRPLKGRMNIVLTRNPGWSHPDVVVVRTREDALAVAYEELHRTGAEEIAVIGGAETAHTFMPMLNRIYLTEIHRAYDGDTTFKFDPREWREAARQDCAPDNEGAPSFSFVTMDRVQ